MDQGILKNIFLTSIYQVSNNFPEKLKNIVEYLFRTENHVDISFETIHLYLELMEAQYLLIISNTIKNL